MSLLEQTAAELRRQLESSQTLQPRGRPGISRPDRQGRQSRRWRFSSVEPDRSLARAKEIDDRRAAGKPVGLLAGLPVAIKDVLCTKGGPRPAARGCSRTSCRRTMRRSSPKLKAADAVLIGQTNMDEFAMGGSTENSAFQKTRNPWDLERTPGGSSGGAAACVAADDGAALDRHRHRRLDSPAGRPLRRHRPEADLRPREPLRPGRVRQQPRPDRPAGPHGRRRGAAARSDRRPRPARRDVASIARCRRTRETVDAAARRV